MITTISLIRADVGGYTGHSSVHPAFIETKETKPAMVKNHSALLDFSVQICHDDLELIMSHMKGSDCEEVHVLGRENFETVTEVTENHKLCVADLKHLAYAFFRNIRVMSKNASEMKHLAKGFSIAESAVILAPIGFLDMIDQTGLAKGIITGLAVKLIWELLIPYLKKNARIRKICRSIRYLYRNAMKALRKVYLPYPLQELDIRNISCIP
jgi:hypothetical protein